MNFLPSRKRDIFLSMWLFSIILFFSLKIIELRFDVLLGNIIGADICVGIISFIAMLSCTLSVIFKKNIKRVNIKSIWLFISNSLKKDIKINFPNLMMSLLISIGVLVFFNLLGMGIFTTYSGSLIFSDIVIVAIATFLFLKTKYQVAILPLIIFQAFINFAILSPVKEYLECMTFEGEYTLAPEFIRALDLRDQRIGDAVEEGYAFDYLGVDLKKWKNCLDIQYDDGESLPLDASGIFYFDEGSSLNRLKIVVNNSYRESDDLLTSILLQHELTHVAQFIAYKTQGTTMSCLDKEVDAHYWTFLYNTYLNSQEQLSLKGLYNAYYDLYYEWEDESKKLGDSNPHADVLGELEYIVGLSDVWRKFTEECKNSVNVNNSCENAKLKNFLRDYISCNEYYQKQCGISANGIDCLSVNNALIPESSKDNVSSYNYNTSNVSGYSQEDLFNILQFRDNVNFMYDSWFSKNIMYYNSDNVQKIQDYISKSKNILDVIVPKILSNQLLSSNEISQYEDSINYYNRAVDIAVEMND